MAISFVSTDSALSTTVAMPTHQTGDLIIIATRGTGAITAPGTFTNLVNASTPFGYRIQYKIAASSSETTGTWTGANFIAICVYRGVLSLNTGNWQLSSTNTNSVTYPAATLSTTAGTSWVVCIGLGNQTSGWLSNIPSVYTARTSQTNKGVIMDSNGGAVANPTLQTQTMGVSDRDSGFTIEIKYDPAAGGGGAVNSSFLGFF